MTRALTRRISAAALFLKVHDLDPMLAEPSSNRPVVRLCALILSEALLGGWDEIRVCAAGPEGAAVQYRRAGEWVDVMRVPAPVQAPIINRLKVMANLDVAKRPVQAGSLRVRLQGQVLELSIAVSGSRAGEEASVRLPERTGLVAQEPAK